MTNRKVKDRQREHQANERTFLAWLRTSISLIGFGLAIARFGLFLRQFQITANQTLETRDFTSNSEILGMSLVIVGIIIVGLAAWRYNRVYWQIERENYRPNRLIIWIISILIMLLGTLSLPLLWNGQKSPLNRDRSSPSGYLPK